MRVNVYKTNNNRHLEQYVVSHSSPPDNALRAPCSTLPSHGEAPSHNWWDFRLQKRTFWQSLYTFILSVPSLCTCIILYCFLSRLAQGRFNRLICVLDGRSGKLCASTRTEDREDPQKSSPLAPFTTRLTSIFQVASCELCCSPGSFEIGCLKLFGTLREKNKIWTLCNMSSVCNSIGIFKPLYINQGAKHQPSKINLQLRMVAGPCLTCHKY